jgi:hypothetical protein
MDRTFVAGGRRDTVSGYYLENTLYDNPLAANFIILTIGRHGNRLVCIHATS